MKVELHLGDCLEVMRGIPDKSMDAVITDPPYFAIAERRIAEAQMQLRLPLEEE